MLSELQFGAFLIFSPRGTGEQSQLSRGLVHHLKDDRIYPNTRQTSSVRLAKSMAQHLPETELGEFLDPSCWLVPVPRSSRLAEGALWPAKRIADALLAEGFGEKVLPCLERHTAVPKSSHASPRQRTKAHRHYETIEVKRTLLEDPPLLMLVDDVVTQGATLIGAASRLQEAFPEAEIRAFAAARTMGLQSDVDRQVEPCVGRISLQPNGWIARNP